MKFTTSNQVANRARFLLEEIADARRQRESISKKKVRFAAPFCQLEKKDIIIPSGNQSYPYRTIRPRLLNDSVEVWLPIKTEPF